MFFVSTFSLRRTVRKKYYYVYDLSSLAGDAGGMLGMLLGASALAAYDAARDLVSRVAASATSRGM